MSLYADLGLSPDATPEQIKAAHRKRARETHPDRGGDPAEFQAVSHAYMVLFDPVKREKYDRTGDTSDGVENPMAAYAEIIMPAFDAAVGECLQQLEFSDVVMIARRKIAEAAQALRMKLKECDAMLEQIKRVLKRLNFAGSGPDIIKGTLDARMMQLMRQRAQVEALIRHHERAIELAADYSWDKEQAPPPPVFRGFSTSASTTSTW